MKCPAPSPTRWPESRSTLLLLMGGNLGVLQSQWVLIFCNDIRQKRQCGSFLTRLQGPPRPILISPVARRGGNGRQICGRAKNAGFLESPSYAVIAKSCFLSSMYTANLFSPFILEGMRWLGNSLSYPYFRFFPYFRTWLQKKIRPLNAVWTFASKYFFQHGKDQPWNNQASHPIMQQTGKLFVPVHCGFHSSECFFPSGNSSNWTNWSVFWQVITAQKTYLWNYILVASSKVNWNLGITAHLGNYYAIAFICYENIAWVFVVDNRWCYT